MKFLFCLTLRRDLLEQRYSTGSIPLLYSTGSIPLLTSSHCSKTCGGPEAFTYSTIFKKCVVISCSEGRNATSCQPIRAPHTHRLEHKDQISHNQTLKSTWTLQSKYEKHVGL